MKMDEIVGEKDDGKKKMDMGVIIELLCIGM